MQDQRSSIGSLPETLGFDHGSTSNDSAVEPQICWNNTRNTSQNDSDITYTNSVNQEGSNLSGWSIGEPSSSQIVHNNDRKVEHDWLSSLDDCNGSNPISEDRQTMRNISVGNADNAIDITDSAPQAQDRIIDDIDSQDMDIPISNSDSLHSFLEENEGRRLNCKRKALEGQSSASGSSNYFHNGDYVNHNGNNGLIISEVNPRLGLGVGPEIRPSAAQAFEASRRNLRLRINASSGQQDSVIPNLFASPHHHIYRLNPFGTMDPNAPLPPPMSDPAILTMDPAVLQGHRRNHNASRWSRGSSSRSGGFLDSAAEGDRISRTAQNNIPENQIYVPPAQSTVDWSFNNDASSSRGANQPSPAVAHNFAPHHRHSSHYPRRLVREYVHRSLMASESRGHMGNFAAPTSSSHEMPAPGGGQGQQASSSRAAMLMDRQQVEGTFGIPYPVRNLSAGGEGRNRLVVSEHIRNVLDLMRRGEGLRFEDVVLLDQSVFFGMGSDMHDRHRDLRLDVDNMSYEELLALEERIGNVNTGLSEDIILAKLKQSKYVLVSTPIIDPQPCCVCQEEYHDDDDLGTLDCGHEFHRDCIKQWLVCKNLCPICKTTALIT